MVPQGGRESLLFIHLFLRGKKGGSASRRQTEWKCDAEQKDAGFDLYTVSQHGGRQTKSPSRHYIAYSFTFTSQQTMLQLFSTFKQCFVQGNQATQAHTFIYLGMKPKSNQFWNGSQLTSVMTGHDFQLQSKHRLGLQIIPSSETFVC